MPHIIIEYSQNLDEKISVGSLLEVLHNSLADSGIDRARIKTRAIRLDDYVVGFEGNRKGAMIHATLLLLEGRDDAIKKTYAEPMHAILKGAVRDVAPGCAVTMEVRDMRANTYFL